MKIVMQACLVGSVLCLPFENFSASAQGSQCRKCVNDALQGSTEKALAATALGAIGGLAVGSLPGAVCGAVIGAVGAAIDKMIEVSNCEKVCVEEANTKKDVRADKCSEMATKARGK